MKITRIVVYGQEQPFRAGPYRCRNRSEAGFLSTLVEIRSSEGLSGWGEIAPLGAFYSEAFAEGVRAGLARLAPELIGRDPREIGKLVRELDQAMLGQMDVKTPLDMALWDLFARAADLPLAVCLGGIYGESVPLYRSISQAEPEVMAAAAAGYLAEGYRRLQVKVGEEPLRDAERLAAVADAVGPEVVLYCDANGAWGSQAALRFLEATRAYDYVLEQPCASYEENLIVRRRCAKPFVLDESLTSLESLLAMRRDGAVDGITIKLSRLGGITRSRQVRDLALDFGLQVTVEDTGGAETDSAAIAHLCLSTPVAQRTHTVDFHNWVARGHADAGPPVAEGAMRLPPGPGLGITPRPELLGPPLFEIAG